MHDTEGVSILTIQSMRVRSRSGTLGTGTNRLNIYGFYLNSQIKLKAFLNTLLL